MKFSHKTGIFFQIPLSNKTFLFKFKEYLFELESRLFDQTERLPPCCLTFLCLRYEESGGGILIYPCPSIRPSGYRYMVCPAISSYSFRATALIFCRMFIHMMEVCMSTGLVIFLCPRDEKSGGGIFVKYSHKMTGGWTSFPSY